MTTDFIQATPKCPDCGGTLATDEDNLSDNSEIACKACGKHIGTYAEVKQAALQAVAVDAKRALAKEIKKINIKLRF